MMAGKNINVKLFQALLCISLLVISGNLFSQTYKIRGNISNIYGNPVTYATVQLLVNSEHNQSAITDSLGNYYLEATKQGECNLLIRCLGYSQTQSRFVLKNDTIVNTTLLTDSTILNEVTIIGHKDLIQLKSDRYIVNINGNIETEGKETTDILKQLPTINLSNETLNIFGKSSVLVYINDREVRLEGQDLISYLNSLPPDVINSVEIISTPPAQYDAEGNIGIIKVVTNKNILPGWKEYIKAGYIKNSYSSYMISAYANYSGKNFFFEGSLTNADFSNLNQSNYYSYFPDATTVAYNPKKWNSKGLDINASLGYTFNQNTSIIVDLSIPLYNKSLVSDIENEIKFINQNNTQTDSIIYTNGITMKNDYAYNSELFFKHLFPKKKTYLTASVAYLNNYSLNERSFVSYTQIGSASLNKENYFTSGSQNYDILTSKIDFAFPLFTCNVNTGIKNSIINTKSNSNFYTIVNNANLMDSTLSNIYNYSENVNSLYYSIEKRLKKWSFKVGVRSEFSGTISNSVTLNEVNKNNYIDFFPTLFISNKLNNKSNISLTYSERIERPPYQYLDPFKWYISKYDYSMGNPFLRPSYIKNLELTYYSNTFSTKIYYTHQNDIIGKYVVLDSLDITKQIEKSDNFLNMNSYGINVYKFLKYKKLLEIVLQGNFTYSEYQSNRSEFVNIAGVNGTFVMMNTFYVGNMLQFVCNIEEGIPGLYNYRTMKNYYKFDLGFNFIYNKKALEVRFLVTDVFKTANPEYSYISGGVEQIYKNYSDTRMLKVILSWRLGNWFNRTSSISLPSNSEEKQRL
jgi:hypothetical protein